MPRVICRRDSVGILWCRLVGQRRCRDHIEHDAAHRAIRGIAGRGRAVALVAALRTGPDVGRLVDDGGCVGHGMILLFA